MTRFIDLSHAIEHGMTTYKGVAAPHICDYWTREQSRANYADGSAFQMGRIDMVSNTGTYLDAPKSLTITAKPAQPLPMSQIMGAAMMAPQSLPTVLGAEVAAND